MMHRRINVVRQAFSILFLLYLLTSECYSDQIGDTSYLSARDIPKGQSVSLQNCSIVGESPEGNSSVRPKLCDFISDPDLRNEFCKDPTSSWVILKTGISYRNSNPSQFLADRFNALADQYPNYNMKLICSKKNRKCADCTGTTDLLHLVELEFRSKPNDSESRLVGTRCSSESNLDTFFESLRARSSSFTALRSMSSSTHIQAILRSEIIPSRSFWEAIDMYAFYSVENEEINLLRIIATGRLAPGVGEAPPPSAAFSEDIRENFASDFNHFVSGLAEQAKTNLESTCG